MLRRTPRPLFSSQLFHRSLAQATQQQKKKKKVTAVFKSVSEGEIKAAAAQGAALRRLFELRNVETRRESDLAQLDAAGVLREVREHVKRHHVAKLSWLHLFLSKVRGIVQLSRFVSCIVTFPTPTKIETKEEADTLVPGVLVEYQATGQQLTSTTAGVLVNLTLRTGSDVALHVFCNAARFRFGQLAHFLFVMVLCC